VSVALLYCQESAVIVCKLSISVVEAVALSIVIIRNLLERLKVVFVVQIEDSSGVINRRFIKLNVVLRDLLVSEVDIKH
ncbi:hypothetical protein EK21DRAFT_81346, partial [Setomelanomma holmii]